MTGTGVARALACAAVAGIALPAAAAPPGAPGVRRVDATVRGSRVVVIVRLARPVDVTVTAHLQRSRRSPVTGRMIFVAAGPTRVVSARRARAVSVALPRPRPGTYRAWLVVANRAGTRIVRHELRVPAARG